MHFWFLQNSERLQLERAQLDELRHTEKWLVGAEWLIDGDLCIDAIINSHGHDYELRLSFPKLYPEVPSVVRPKNELSRLSSHQYGDANGPLCLEWGSDNWRRDITAAIMLRSAHRLLETENPRGESKPEKPAIAPSRHKLTEGQQTRGKNERWLLTKTFKAFIEGNPSPSSGSFKFSYRSVGPTWIAIVHEALSHRAEMHKEQVPTNLQFEAEKNRTVGIWFNSEHTPDSFGNPTTLDELKQLLSAQGGNELLATDGTSPIVGFNNLLSGVLVGFTNGELRFYIVITSTKTLLPSVALNSSDSDQLKRAPTAEQLRTKLFGIVGAGSAGSKIAVSLARMGVKKFYLVDYDILLPENLKRHALNWESVGLHKTDALALEIQRIEASVNIDTSQLHLTGQESSAAVGGTIDRLGDCDIIIDATANPRVFNLIAGIAQKTKKPIVWLEVFAGGIGGLIARSRPKLDPCPQDMRNGYLQFCSEQTVPGYQPPIADYTVETQEGEIITASDADVGVIAQHAVSIAVDTAINPETSKFPHSMYLIGLSRGWIFNEPFENIPITMSAYDISGWTADEKEITPDAVTFVAGLLETLPKKADETPTPKTHSDPAP